jgi:putative membrane protein
MKRVAVIATLLGLLLLIGLVIHEGVDDVAAVIGAAGFALLWLVPLHVVPLVFDARGWQTLLDRRRASLSYLTWIAAVREAVNRLLPAANIGGELVGIRLASRVIPEAGIVTASVIVEVLVTLCAQYLLCALGVVLTIVAVARVPEENALIVALLLSLPVPLLLLWALREGELFSRIESFAKRLVGASNATLAGFDGQLLDITLRALLKQHVRLFKVLLWQLGGMALGTLETWLALFLLGHPVGFIAAFAIEALSVAIRSVVFFVPSGLGVQEAGILMLAQLFGVGPDVALSLALVKRMREVLFGVPALLSWQWFEALQLKRPTTHA